MHILAELVDKEVSGCRAAVAVWPSRTPRRSMVKRSGPFRYSAVICQVKKCGEQSPSPVAFVSLFCPDESMRPTTVLLPHSQKVSCRMPWLVQADLKVYYTIEVDREESGDER